MKNTVAISLSFFLPLGVIFTGYASSSIITSDGPEGAAPTNSAHQAIVVTDGPMEYTSAERAGKRLTGAWVVETSGPGTARLVVPAHDLPDPERSALAPAIAVTPATHSALHTQIQKTVIPVETWSRPKRENAFEVYSDKKYGAHFLPTGFMGDYGDVRVEEGSEKQPHSGSTCIQVAYAARSSQGNGWAGMYWQNPANNWGDKTGGYDLTGKKRLIFWARGEKGGEVISDFRMGGIGGQQGDSDSANIGPITLTKQWKKYSIGLNQKNLRHIIGGFSWSANREANPDGMTFYLDDIRYE